MTVFHAIERATTDRRLSRIALTTQRHSTLLNVFAKSDHAGPRHQMIATAPAAPRNTTAMRNHGARRLTRPPPRRYRAGDARGAPTRAGPRRAHARPRRAAAAPPRRRADRRPRRTARPRRRAARARPPHPRAPRGT